MTKDIKKEIEFKGIVIGRIPETARKLFKELAKQEFADDYGMTLRTILYDYFEYQNLKGMFLSGNLPIKIGLQEDASNKEETGESESQPLGGGIRTKFNKGGKNGEN